MNFNEYCEISGSKLADKKIKFEWECLSNKYIFNIDGKELKTSRAKVIGGWLILHLQMQLVNGQIVKSESMTFIPDKNHEWEIK